MIGRSGRGAFWDDLDGKWCCMYMERYDKRDYKELYEQLQGSIGTSGPYRIMMRASVLAYCTTCIFPLLYFGSWANFSSFWDVQFPESETSPMPSRNRFLRTVFSLRLSHPSLPKQHVPTILIYFKQRSHPDPSLQLSESESPPYGKFPASSQSYFVSRQTLFLPPDQVHLQCVVALQAWYS